MKEQINGRLDDKRIEHYKSILHSIAQHSSERERAAQDAERDCDDLKKAEFMMDKVGQYFQGTISNITAFGLFVELDNTVEGLVRLSSMDDDYYTYNERSFCLIGERTRKIYRIGDKVNVQLIKVNVESRQIDFIIVDENEVNGSKSEIKEPERIRKKSSKDNEHLLKHIGAVKKNKKK